MSNLEFSLTRCRSLKRIRTISVQGRIRVRFISSNVRQTDGEQDSRSTQASPRECKVNTSRNNHEPAHRFCFALPWSLHPVASGYVDEVAGINHLLLLLLSLRGPLLFELRACDCAPPGLSS